MYVCVCNCNVTVIKLLAYITRIHVCMGMYVWIIITNQNAVPEQTVIKLLAYITRIHIYIHAYIHTYIQSTQFYTAWISVGLLLLKQMNMNTIPGKLPRSVLWDFSLFPWRCVTFSMCMYYACMYLLWHNRCFRIRCSSFGGVLVRVCIHVCICAGNCPCKCFRVRCSSFGGVLVYECIHVCICCDTIAGKLPKSVLWDLSLFLWRCVKFGMCMYVCMHAFVVTQ